MQSNAKSITQLAYEEIDEIRKAVEPFQTPEEALDFLEDKSQFLTLSELLKETMVDAGICNASDTDSRFINVLYHLLAKQDEECEEKARSDAAIKRWIRGTTKSIDYRHTAIEICFALGLSADRSRDFLYKCGFHAFNVRDAEDAVYLYSLLKHRSLAAAKELYNKYLDADVISENENQLKQVTHSGHTTIILKNQVLGDWESDDSFLNTFLIPNKSKFLGYSFTATKTYYVLKNILFVTVLMDILSDEEYLEAERNLFYKKKESFESDPQITKEYIPISLAFRSALAKYNDDSSVFYSLNQKLKNHIETPKQILGRVRKLIASKSDNISTDISLQMEIAEFLNDIINNEDLLKRICWSLRNKKTNTFRGKKESSFKDTVMKDFPYADAFAGLEKEPSIMYSKQEHGKTVATRKALVLMYFIIYAYELPLFLDDLHYTSYTFDDIAESINIPDINDEFYNFRQMGFGEFFDSLNIILDYCQYSKLYIKNQFDWLILKSIWEIENNYETTEGNSPLEFFNDVLLYSFNGKVSEKNNKSKEIE